MYGFGSKGKPSLAIDNIAIPIVTSTKFLGIIIDGNMSWKEHTASLINNWISQKYMLQLVRKFIPIQTKRLLYCAHVLSRIKHGLVIWGLMKNQASKSSKYKKIALSYV